MKLSKGEYCQFSLRGKEKLLQEFGIPVCRKTIGDRCISIFRLYDFYVERTDNTHTNRIEKIEPVGFFDMRKFMEEG